MRHILSLLMENESGALSRVAGLFSARGYNIESLTVAPTEDPTLSRMTLVTRGSEQIIEQIIKQLNKLVDVVKLIDLTEGEHIERELMLIKIRTADENQRAEIGRLAEPNGGTLVDESGDTVTVELIGSGDQLDAFINSVERSSIIETVRTGASGISRGTRSLRI